MMEKEKKNSTQRVRKPARRKIPDRQERFMSDSDLKATKARNQVQSRVEKRLEKQDKVKRSMM